jgi:superfamily II DNA/RNA helicase
LFESCFDNHIWHFELDYLRRHLISVFYCGIIIQVLDEADRILDLGFKDTMNAVIENLPEERQTLLFSATQTK